MYHRSKLDKEADNSIINEIKRNDYENLSIAFNVRNYNLRRHHILIFIPNENLRRNLESFSMVVFPHTKF